MKYHINRPWIILIKRQAEWDSTFQTLLGTISSTYFGPDMSGRIRNNEQHGYWKYITNAFGKNEALFDMWL